MKIAYILSACSNHGPFIVARDIINNISGKVERIDIFYLKDSGQKLEFNAKLVKVNLFRKTDFSGYDVVHTHGFLGDVYGYLNRASIRNWITTIHQEIGPSYSLNYGRVIGSIIEKFWCFIIKRSNTIVTLTEAMAADYRTMITHPRIMAIHNGTTPVLQNKVSAEEEISLSALKANYRVLGIAASLIYLKGIDRVIEALALPSGKHFALIVIGEGKLKAELKELAYKLGVSDRCLFLGYKSNAIDYFRFFDVYIMASRSEGFGLCVIEAASQKIPVACNDLPAYKELFTDEVVRFSLENLQSLINAINYTLQNRSEFSKKIHEKYLISFTASVMADRYLTLYIDR